MYKRQQFYGTSRADSTRHFVRPLIGKLATTACAMLFLSATLSGANLTRSAQAAANETRDQTARKVRLLTTEQYVNTIRYFFGPDIKVDVSFAPLARTEGLLAAGAAVAGISGSQTEIYQKAAAVVAEQVFSPARRAALLPCKPKAENKADNACAEHFLRDVTSYLYRVPESKERIAALVAKAGESANILGDFYAGLQFVLEGVLLSPNVLFVASDNESAADENAPTKLDGIALATRLSLFLWNAAPDPTLRRAALKGELSTERGLARTVDAMLASPRLEDGVRAFLDDMFYFDDFHTLSKDAASYPYFVGESLRDAREQTLRTAIDHLINKNLDYRDLYTTRETFVTPALALVYGVPTTPGWRHIVFPPEAHRDGILTHVSFLALHSHATRTSPTLRGKALREILMCQPVPPPPGNVDFSALENPDPKIKTTRERVALHLSNPVCAGCHKVTDPIGLALENFDGAGKYRDSESGAPIDATGNFDGKTFSDVRGLSEAVRNHPALPGCFVTRAMGYAVGVPTAGRLKPEITDLTKSFAADGYRTRGLLRAIALSPAFRSASDAQVKRATPQKEAAAGPSKVALKGD